MFLGRGTMSSVIQAARLAARWRQRASEDAGGAREKERADSRVAGLFKQVQRARDVGVDAVLAGVRGHMRFVQSRGVDNGIHAAYARSNEPPVDDRSDAMGESRLLDVEAERLMTGER